MFVCLYFCVCVCVCVDIEICTCVFCDCMLRFGENIFIYSGWDVCWYFEMFFGLYGLFWISGLVNNEDKNRQ